MKKWMGIALMCAATMAGAAERPLPALALADADGAAASAWMPARATPWILLVVDPARQQTQGALARLQLQADGDGVVVVVIGDEMAFQALRKRYNTLPGLRWYRDTSGTLLRTLRLPGLPAVLGMTPDNQVAWQVIGVPEHAGKAHSLVASWLTPGRAGAAVRP